MGREANLLQQLLDAVSKGFSSLSDLVRGGNADLDKLAKATVRVSGSQSVRVITPDVQTIQGTGPNGTIPIEVVAASGASSATLSILSPLPLPVQPQRAATVSPSSVSPGGSVQTLLSSNSSRIGFTVFNDTDRDLYVKLGSGAATNNFDLRLAPKQLYESSLPVYTGQVTGITSGAAAGTVRVTEMLP